MAEPSSYIGITVTDQTGAHIVFVCSTPPTLAFNERFAAIELARGYADELSVAMGLPVRDATLGTQHAYGSHQGGISRLLMLMATAAQSGNADWNAPDFWAHAAYNHAETIASAMNAMSGAHLAFNIAIGGAMLRQAARDLSLATVSDVIALIVPVEGEA